MKTNNLLFDTDVIIDYLREEEKAVLYFENITQSSFLISTITIAELYCGVKPAEATALENFISLFEIVDLDRKIAELGGFFRQNYLKSHGVGIADALIAATAKIRQATLVTLNKKHFPMLDKILIPYRKQDLATVDCIACH